MQIQEFIEFENGCKILKPTPPTTPPPLNDLQTILVAPPRTSSLLKKPKFQNGLDIVEDKDKNFG